jgi:hypothetical protein
MRGYLVGAAAIVIGLLGTTSAGAQTPLKDVDSEHSSDAAVTELVQKGILVGEPDGQFHGKRPMTRNEFAVAMERALKWAESQRGPQGPAGPAGAQGKPGQPGPAGMAPHEVAEMHEVMQALTEELATLKSIVRTASQRVDTTAGSVRALQSGDEVENGLSDSHSSPAKSSTRGKADTARQRAEGIALLSRLQ